MSRLLGIDHYCSACGRFRSLGAAAMCGNCIGAWAAKHPATLPRTVLDGCGGAGGAARGYVQAGFEVWGVDSNPRLEQDYLASGAARFICADILEILADRQFVHSFDFVHLSAPCFAAGTSGLSARYPDLITPSRPLLEASGRPWVIENVGAARTALRDPVALCMFMFGRKAYRHRLFETGGGFTFAAPLPVPATLPPGTRLNRECGWPHPVPAAKAGHWQPGMFVSVSGHERKRPVQEVMETPWMRDREDVKEAIPPYFTRYLGGELLRQIGLKQDA